MRILTIADEQPKYLWDYYEPEKLRGYDLIVGCGDQIGRASCRERV